MPSTVNSATATPVDGFVQYVGAHRDVFTQEIYMQALPAMRYEQFATRKEELMAQPGMTVTMPKFNALRRGGPLVEGIRMETQRMSQSQIQITVREWGNAVAVTEFLTQTSFFDQMMVASVLLGRDVATVQDLDLRDVLTGGLNKLYGDGTVLSRAAITSGMKFGPTVIYKAVSRLETQNVPKWGNDFYVCIIHPHQLASLRQSPGWINAQMYAGTGGIFFGEAGRWNDVRFISSSHVPNGWSNALDTSTGQYADAGFVPELENGFAGNQTTIYQAVIFGQFAYGLAVALPVGLRDSGIKDFGREHGIAWYGIWGSGLLDTSNSLVIETAGDGALPALLLGKEQLTSTGAKANVRYCPHEHQRVREGHQRGAALRLPRRHPRCHVLGRSPHHPPGQPSGEGLHGSPRPAREVRRRRGRRADQDPRRDHLDVVHRDHWSRHDPARRCSRWRWRQRGVAPHRRHAHLIRRLV